MKIEKVRIKNFKSVVDSGDIYFEPDLTILAGKNESGKSTVLEALEAFNKDIAFNTEYQSLQVQKQGTSISITFILTKQELETYLKRIKVLHNELPEFVKLTVTKSSNQIIVIDEDSRKLFGFSNAHFSFPDIKNIPVLINKQIGELKAIYEQATTSKLVFLDFGSNEAYLHYLDTFKKAKQPEALIKNTLLNISFTKILNNIESTAVHHVHVLSKWQILIDMLPNFILFKSFESIVPDEFVIKEGLKNKVGQFIAKQLGLTVFSFLTPDERTKIKAKNKINQELQGHYLQNWSQDKAYIQLEYSGEKATVWIVENDEFFKPSQRSRGKQWHLSFFFSIESDFQSNKTNIILIDEPGLYLHAKAQEDIYNFLLQTSQKGQIIFSTHSPYLMNGEEIHRIRLVHKETIEKGTTVDGSLIFKSDKETLTPVLTAIGVGLNQGIVGIDKKYNVVVEGLSDYFYLNIFKRLLNINEINFISGGGAGNMGYIIAILSGWGTEVLYLFDKDQGGKDGTKKLKNWEIDTERILKVYDGNQAIEDMFSVNDFKKYILKDESIVIDVKNSEYMKINSVRKVITAKQFYNKFNKEVDLTFEQETLENFKKILMGIESTFRRLE